MVIFLFQVNRKNTFVSNILIMKFKNIAVSFFTMFAIWLLLNKGYSIPIIISGVVVSLIISIAFCKSCDVLADIKFTPKAIVYSFIYLFVFLSELIKSNFDVAKRVLSPKLPINPGIVEVKTKLKSKVGRMILANSITLTPGTFTVEIIDERLFIHWIDVKSENVDEDTKMIVEKFEKYLEVIYG
jgi:multicomponent Na+:H+ antiporter subunit E